ncbi:MULTISPECIES: hypothetical protein [Tsukamurella]|uniref:Uncharacterized protein n=2 Tax=Tsukamurella TaxID=2060 RepID=A0A5C5S5D9_9ACTN|nr:MULTISPECIES: hypothetical protein [Tsukamurella]NMD56943.1 hypothetical protein [Tsukamurella columbiensis]TWS29843.1 hypothetical protein FK530_04725 [Tsukamurella conjunctivitidis]
MSEERRISLAELLAREGGAPAAPAGGRRRRHRGGENSITVAELTGEIPVVRDDTPAPGTESTPAQPTAPAPAAPAAQEAPAQRDVYEPEVVEPEVVEAQPEPTAPTAEQAAPAQEVAQDDDEPITSSFLAAAVADPGPAEAPVQEEPAAPAADEAPAERESRRSGLLRWNRGSRSAAEAPQQPQEPAQSDEPAAQAADAPVADAPATDATDAPAEDGRDYAWSRWDQAEAPIMATADFNTAQVRERQSRFAEVEADDTVDVRPVAVPDADVAADAPAAPDTASMSAEQIDDARAAETPDFLATTGDVEDEEKAPSTGKGRGWLALAAEVVLGLVAGAGLFYGFFKLWNWGGGKATIALTVVLAFIVIIGIVTFTHYLRKTTDYLTLGLALFVGLVITFGPLLMALGSN